MRARRLLFGSFFFTVLAIGCGDDDGPRDAAVDASADAPADVALDVAPDAEPSGTDWPAMRPERSTVPVAGVRRELIRVPGVTPPANPTTGATTPPELNATTILRYRRDVSPPAEPRAVIVCMPGFLSGGASFEGLARALVRRGVGGEAVEVWAVDRRSNALEDLAGMDAAEVLGNPEVAQGYYFGDDTVGGQAFEGYVPQDELAFMSEWGLATHAEDLRRVVHLVPEAERARRVFLLGHSLGASFTEAYAAWRFEDGVRGVEELAGLILVDGALGDAPIEQSAYLDGSTAGPFPTPGLTTIRAEGPRYTTLPILGIDVYARVEISSLRYLTDPAAVVSDPGRDRILGILMGLAPARVPELTNAAALGLAFDDETQPLLFVRAKIGRLVGGPIEMYESGLAGGEVLARPGDPGGTYGWEDALEVEPAELTPLRNLAESFVHGQTNFAEWYFPARLSLDLGAVGGARVAEDSWQAAEGLRSFDGALIDAPLLAIAAGLIGDPARYEAIRDRVAPSVGAGRPAAGLPRSDPRAFQVVDATHMAHIDPVTADDESAANPVPGAIEAFVAEHAAADTFTLGEL